MVLATYCAVLHEVVAVVRADLVSLVTVSKTQTRQLLPDLPLVDDEDVDVMVGTEVTQSLPCELVAAEQVQHARVVAVVLVVTLVVELVRKDSDVHVAASTWQRDLIDADESRAVKRTARWRWLRRQLTVAV